MTLRTLILMTAPQSASGPIWVFDTLALGALAGMLLQLPRRAKGRIDYGLVPWLTTILVMVPLLASAWALNYAAELLIKLGPLDPVWLWTVTLLPATTATGLGIFLLTPGGGPVPPSKLAFAHPRMPSIARLGLWLLALPSFAASFVVGGYASYIIATQITAFGSAAAGSRLWSTIYAIDLAGAAIAGVTIYLILRNVSTITRWTAGLEALLVCLIVGFGATVLVLIFEAQGLAARTSRSLGMEVILEIWNAASMTLGGIFIAAVGTAALILLPSWWARSKLSRSEQ